MFYEIKSERPLRAMDWLPNHPLTKTDAEYWVEWLEHQYGQSRESLNITVEAVNEHP